MDIRPSPRTIEGAGITINEGISFADGIGGAITR